jgi:hypothetical protein
MKKLLLNAALLAGLVGSAHADQLPKAFIGTWCYTGDRYLASDHYISCTRKDNINGNITITRNKFLEQENSCEFVSIKTKHTTTRSVESNIIMLCKADDGSTNKQKFDFYWDKDGLYIFKPDK